jgi:hypothetical protein
MNDPGSTWRSILVSLVADPGRCQKARAKEKTKNPSAMARSRLSLGMAARRVRSGALAALASLARRVNVLLTRVELIVLELETRSGQVRQDPADRRQPGGHEGD